MASWFDFSTSTLSPHGVCLSWDPVLLILHGGADLAMSLSYFAVAASIAYFGHKRPDIGPAPLFNVLAAVFALCGFVHLSDIIVLTVPAYATQGAFKTATAAASVAAVVIIWRLMPKALSLPSVAQLQAANERLWLLSTAVEQSTNVVIITNPDGVIEYVNPRFTAVSGFPASEAVGKTPRILKSGATAPETYKKLWAALLSGKPWRGEFEERSRDGAPFWVTTSVFPMRDDGGRIIHFVAMQDDITERKLAEQQMREAREMAEIASRAKTELIANMSHELRTPLNAIIGFSSAMITGALGAVDNPRHHEYLTDIHNSGEHLLSLINDILDVSAIEVGKMRLAAERVELSDLVRASARMVAPRAQDGGVDISLDVPAELPPIEVDPRRIKQVLVNLLSNAVKFTPAGGRVALRCVVDADGIAITVADTGIGMSETELAKAMLPFEQVDSSLARRHEGTGLGLPLAKGLVEAHGGTLVLSSRKEEGTTAVVRLPAERVCQPVA